MKEYLDILKSVLEEGVTSEDRTGTGTVSKFGGTAKWDLSKGFPLLTTKKINFELVKAELLWFLEGSTNNNRLNELGAKIWNPWATPSGALGGVYGEQWVSWKDLKLIAISDLVKYNQRGYTVKRFINSKEVLVERTINQIEELIRNLKWKPRSRRHLVTAWNPSVLPDETYSPQTNVEMGNAALPACHAFFQFYTKALTVKERIGICKNESALYTIKNGDIWLEAEGILDSVGVPKYSLSCQFYMRSVDVPVGLPFNIASYALLTHLVAQVCNFTVGELSWVGGDVHIYLNQLDNVERQLELTPTTLPTLKLNSKVENIFAFKMEDVTLVDYNPLPAIKYPVSV